MVRDVLTVLIVILILAIGCVIAFDVLQLGGGTKPPSSPQPYVRVDPQRPTPTDRHKPDEKSLEPRKPDVVLFDDKCAYSQWYSGPGSESGVDSRPPDTVDFNVHQVLVVAWGDRPASGYEVLVKSSVVEDLETVVTIETRLPEPGQVKPMPSYPAVTAAVPRGKRVHVIISGQRMPSLDKFPDFVPSTSRSLEVTIRPNEKAAPSK